jgi:type IV pilus assembly protein PilE
MKNNGFSLIELIVAVGILGILAAIAVPAYHSYTMKSNRSDATRTMTLEAQALERCYARNFTYGSNCPTTAGTTISPQGFYSVTIAITNADPSTNTPASYTITAVPAKAPQTSDSACTQFTLNSAGAQGATGTGSTPSQTCWGST